MDKTIYLLLENGQVFEGRPFGYDPGADGADVCETLGEAVFTTGMVGYLETLTDSSYYGQIVIQTFPLIGNYGVIPDDFENATSHVAAYIVRDDCDLPSNFRCQGRLEDFLIANKIVGVRDIDTRGLTRIIRESGTMNAAIITSPSRKLEAMEHLRTYRIENAVENVSCKDFIYHNVPYAKGTIGVWDFGAKDSIRKNLNKRGYNTVNLPAHTSCAQILDMNLSGVLLSNGPGDPAKNTGIIHEIAQLFETDMPIFGICLGHQLLALSQGAHSAKLHYGHRGSNQPALDLTTGRAYETSQNHGYAVVTSSLPRHARLYFTNLNDDSCEGVTYPGKNAFSVQFHPEAAAGPLDSAFLFDKFIDMIESRPNGGEHNA